MIISIKVLEDNYTHFIYTNKVAIAFDCVEPKYVLKLLNKDISKFNKISISKEEIDNLPDLLNPRKLIGFFTTHKHLDHSAGDIFLSKYSKHFKLNNNEIIKLEEWNIKGITTPCHTLDSICFYITCNNSIPIIITGDTLFMLGCGKFFEGTPEMMFNNFRILEKLEGIVLYGHNYNETNIEFTEKYSIIPKEIKNKTFLLMNEEKKYNIFINCKTIKELEKLRNLKDNFKIK